MRRPGIYIASGAAFALALALSVTGTGDRGDVFPNWQALVLGLVQGLTELLPISSSGHLILVPWAGDWTFLKEHDAFNQTFDVALHLGTLVAVVAYFWRDLRGLLVGWIRSVRRRRIETDDERIAWFVAVATVPAAAVGALADRTITEHLGEPWQIAILLAVFAVVLWVADRTPARRGVAELGLGTAVAVGLAQSLALAPGVSRSGITISVARFLGLSRDAAARFSFLLLVPIVLGAVIYEGAATFVGDDLPAGMAGPFVVGTIASAVSGLAAIWALLGYVRRHDYSVFVVYRLIAAAIVLLLIQTGVREPGF